MHVRPFLLVGLAALVIQAPAFAQNAVSGGQDAARGQTADQQVRHVLNRLAFGPRPGDYDRVRQMGVDAWIEQQLHPERIPDAPATQFVSQLRAYTTSPVELERAFPRPQQAQQELARARNATDSMTLL